MNRIIIIGNGFDLAHGLKTSYANFIDWYWKEWGERLLHGQDKVEFDGLCSFSLNNSLSLPKWAYVWGWHYRRTNPFEPWDEKEIVEIAKNDRDLCDFSITSPLLEELCMQLKDRKWVDIENVFYKHLSNDSETPEKVNCEMAIIRARLIEYLKEIQDGVPDGMIKEDVRKKMRDPFNERDIAIGAKDYWKDMLRQRVDYRPGVWQELVSSFLDQNRSFDECQRVQSFLRDYSDRLKTGVIESVSKNNVIPFGYLLPDRVLMLNFNYTNIADAYLPNVERFSVNHIHGELSNPESVIFGYGDEIDENYKKISNKNDNEYLKNIKSIKYLESPNYRNLLDFIESDTYQIYIMGHSCGNSDRTLLNTLFEHRNCVSIKPFYHKRDDGSDNYMELVQNISRNFTDMKLMRDRVVNKSFCETF